ncbi:hypothetical protein PISMIDRAFT_291241 [Pisolithus microcarpus 441]|uniref:Uncharacterized protein n=1 Tax=Pisolithus microcarpus 441 TaxID=765257 RepID=A0A0C9Z008_9AGAM|nr:hypothetical protein BKA83DRAFT_291241 [Pisolithus microcarpus]KIK15677.1 hypothetical protein PISMIDRAFT_291241 [Pisolithus microcarpus 441]
MTTPITSPFTAYLMVHISTRSALTPNSGICAHTKLHGRAQIVVRLPILRPTCYPGRRGQFSIDSAASCYAYALNSDCVSATYRMDVGLEMFVICVSKSLLLALSVRRTQNSLLQSCSLAFSPPPIMTDSDTDLQLPSWSLSGGSSSANLYPFPERLTPDYRAWSREPA